jgi:hypothetical protein
VALVILEFLVARYFRLNQLGLCSLLYPLSPFDPYNLFDPLALLIPWIRLSQFDLYNLLYLLNQFHPYNLFDPLALLIPWIRFAQ